MATFYNDNATLYSCSDHTLLPVSRSLAAVCPTTCGSATTFTDSLLTSPVCNSQATSPYSLMPAALPNALVAGGLSDEVPAIGAAVDVLQCGSLPSSSRHLMTGLLCKSTSRVCLANINSSLLCFLCGGYLIDATTINRCLHSFCRACILRHLKLVNFCPVCKSLLCGSHPHKSLRADRTLQRVIYKVVPGLYRNERERRRKFAAVNRKRQVIHRSHHQRARSQSDHTMVPGSLVYSDDENFSVCLRHQLHLNDDASAYSWTQFPVADDGDGSNDNTGNLISRKQNQLIRRRFVLCPAVTSTQLIRKFLKLKLNLKEQSKVFLFCSGEILPDDYTLLDIAYIFSWMKTGPLLIDYIILNTVLSRDDDACQPSSAAAAAQTEDAQLVQQRNWEYSSSEVTKRGPETECLAFGHFNTNQSCLGGVDRLDHPVLDQNAHLELKRSYQDLNDDKNKGDLTKPNSISPGCCFSHLSNNLPPHHRFLPSFLEVGQLHSSCDASRRPVDLETMKEDTRVTQSNSAANCLEDHSQIQGTLDYSCEAMMTGSGEQCMLRPELSTNQFAQTAYHHQMSYGNDFGHGLTNGLAILPETGLASLHPRLDSGSTCSVGGIYSEDSSCGLRLIGVLAQSIDGHSVIEFPPHSSFIYNRPVIGGWHPGFHEETEEMMDGGGSWTNAGTNSCFVDPRENANEGLQFLLPMMHPRAKTAVAEEVADVTGVVGLPAYQYCATNGQSITDSVGIQPFLPIHGRNFEALPTKAIFNVDARSWMTPQLDNVDPSCQQSWLGTSSQAPLPVSRDGKGNTGGDQAGCCRQTHDKLDTDEQISVEIQLLSEGGLPPPPQPPLPSLHTEDQKESTPQILKVYDLSAGNVSEDKLVIDDRSGVACHVTDDVLKNTSCLLSASREYTTTPVESQEMSACEHHLPQTMTGGHPAQITSCAIPYAVETTQETSSHVTLSSDFPTTLRCSSPAFKCQMTTSDQSKPPTPPLPYAEKQNALQCQMETTASCHSYEEAGSETPRLQTPRTAIQTDAEEMMCRLSAHDHWDERRREGSLTGDVSVSSTLTKPMLTDAAEGESGQLEREPPPVDVELPPFHLSYDISDNVSSDRSLELTTQRT